MPGPGAWLSPSDAGQLMLELAEGKQVTAQNHSMGQLNISYLVTRGQEAGTVL